MRNSDCPLGALNPCAEVAAFALGRVYAAAVVVSSLPDMRPDVDGPRPVFPSSDRSARGLFIGLVAEIRACCARARHTPSLESGPLKNRSGTNTAQIFGMQATFGPNGASSGRSRPTSVSLHAGPQLRLCVFLPPPKSKHLGRIWRRSGRRRSGRIWRRFGPSSAEFRTDVGPGIDQAWPGNSAELGPNDQRWPGIVRNCSDLGQICSG